jgi:hypothetical protein
MPQASWWPPACTWAASWWSLAVLLAGRQTRAWHQCLISLAGVGFLTGL